MTTPPAAAMHEERYTRCPGCKTIFRVTGQQLAIREGQVRCGHCRTVFDGNANMISLAPQPPREPSDAEPDEAALGPPTVTLRSAAALQPAVATEADAPPAKAAVRPAEDVEEIAYEERFAWSRRRKHSPALRALTRASVPMLALALVLQIGVHYRDWIAAHWPSWKPGLSQLCAGLGCTVRPLRDTAALSIDASDLQADAAHKGLLTLTATIRNRAPWPVAHPHLELTLTDAQDRAVVRRALAPADYAGDADVARGIPANSELPVRLFIDASATTQSGYRLFLFYP